MTQHQREGLNQLTEEMITQVSYYECGNEEEDTQASKSVLDLAHQDNVECLEALLYKHPEYLSVRDGANASPLHYAASGGSQRAVRLIVNMAGIEGLNATDDEGNTPLHWAVQRNHRESCVTLMELGADPNILNRAGMAPLHLAVSLGHNSLITPFLSHSSTNVELEGELGNTPVMQSCISDNCEALHILLDHGARMCHQNKLGHFPIHATAFAGAKKSMEYILSKGEEYGYTVEEHINFLDKSKSSPLHLAVRGGNIETIDFCILKGAKIDQKQCDKSTALHFACTQGAMEAVKLMISAYNRAEDIINITDGANQTPLHKATIFDHVELVEYLIEKGADINHVDCKGHTPLLRATASGAWKCVETLLARGASLKIKDKAGRSFLHLAIMQPKGLKNLPENALELDSVRELLSEEDCDGCTPLHYACRLGIAASVENMLGLKVSPGRKSKDKKSALHFAAEYGRINTCQRLLESLCVSRLLNEVDENGMTPLHLACRGGHTKVVDLLLRRGALFHRDYKGWTSLHHAAAEGYTQTMKIILGANIKLLDKADEDGNTALHVAAKEGRTAAVRLLLSSGAEFTLNNNDASFLHEAVHYGRQEVANAAVESERCAEAMRAFKPSSMRRCAVMDLIEILPESFKYLLDLCVKESDHDANSHDYWIEYDFQYLQAPVRLLKYDKAAFRLQPLAALNAMVQYNRVELLTHPVCKKYLEMKWHAYGSKAHILNLTVYSLGLLPLSYLIVNMRPHWPTNGTYVNMVEAAADKRGYFSTICMFLVLAMNFYAVGKEILQIVQQRSNYFRDITNGLDWLCALFSIIFVLPLLMNLEGNMHWQAGAFAVTISWINFLLYLQRFEHFGIYVVMFGEIMRTLVSIISIFFFLMLAFTLGFYALMINQEKFGHPEISLMQTFVMMVGELNYQDNFLNPYLNGKLPFPYLTFIILVWFILLMPILLMNLLIGLAVGDIAEVQKNATLKRIAMQIGLHTSLEEKLPYWFMKRVDQEKITEFPNKKCRKEKPAVRVHLRTNSSLLTPVEHELHKQKHRLKEMASVLEKQHNLLKLIIQKMEIISEAEDQDGPEPSQFRFGRQLSKKSKWVPLVKAVVKKE